MGFFKKDMPAEKIMVKGNTLTCDVCKHDKFFYRESQLNTRLASFFDVDFANKKAYCYICENCTKIQWFLDRL